MVIFVVVIHIITSLLLITVIMMQSGRGGGLTESLSGAESIFGTKTNSFMVRTTSVLAVIFLFTCIGLAVLSTQRNRSLIENELRAQKITPATKSQPITASIPKADAKEVNKEAQPIQKDIVPEKTPQTTK